MDWFEKLTGFRERDWIGTRNLLTLDGSRLISRTNDASYGIGDFELISLGELREQCLALNPVKGTAKLKGAKQGTQRATPRLRLLVRWPAIKTLGKESFGQPPKDFFSCCRGRSARSAQINEDSCTQSDDTKTVIQTINKLAVALRELQM